MFKGFFFLFLALAAILFSRAELLKQFWYRALRGTLLRNYFEIRTLAAAEMSFKGFSIFSSGNHFVQPR